uniref:Protein YIPF6 n=1 Tax=Aceria tosichella TaxID=561515 RepID=A0A6G1SL45_9ACAR
MDPNIYVDVEDAVLNADSISSSHFDEGNLDGQLADGSAETRRRLSDDYNQLDEPILDTLKRDLYGIYNKMKIIALPLSSYDIYKVVLRGWDLWGPLLLCTFLAFNLHHSRNYEDKHTGPQFADVFVLVWFGSCIVSLNYRLLSASSVNNQLISKQILHVTTSNSEQAQQAEVNQLSSQYPEPKIDPTLQDRLDASMGNSPDKPKLSAISSRDQPHHTLVSPPSILQLMCVFGYCLVAPCVGLILLKLFSFYQLFFERIIIGIIFGFAWPTFCSVRILIRYQHPSKRALAIYPIGLFYFVLSCLIILSH